jgi:hypothetical protein
MSRLGRLLNVRPGEGGRVAALFVLSLALGLGLAAIEVAVDTELLAGTPTSELPWAHIAVSVAVFIGGALLAGLRAWLPAAAFIGGPLGLVGLAALLCVPLLDDAPGVVTLLALYAGHHVLVALRGRDLLEPRGAGPSTSSRAADYTASSAPGSWSRCCSSASRRRRCSGPSSCRRCSVGR